MPPICDALSSILPDPDLTLSLGRYDAAAELEKAQTQFYDCFDKLMAASKNLFATYHFMLDIHKDCAGVIKQSVALGQPNSVTVQQVQAQKAQIEQDMLGMESIHLGTMRTVQLLHDGSEWIVWDELSSYN